MKQGEDAAMQGLLAGHEFRFLGHRLHVLESARDTEDQTLLFDYVAPPRREPPGTFIATKRSD